MGTDYSLLAIEGTATKDLVNAVSGKSIAADDLVGGAQNKQNNMVVSPSTVQEKKRPKRNGNDNISEQQNQLSADSSMESDREQ